LLANPDQVAAQGAAAKQWVEATSHPSIVLQKIVRLYQEAAGLRKHA
jgi:hypothetical protein